MSVKGNVDEGLLFCGAKAWKAEHLQTVQEVINDLFYQSSSEADCEYPFDYRNA